MNGIIPNGFTTRFLCSFYLRRSHAGQWIIIVLPYNILEIGAIRGQKSMVTYKIEVTELNFEVRSDLRGCLESAMASEATKAVRGNMHMDTRIIKVAEFKSEVI